MITKRYITYQKLLQNVNFATFFVNKKYFGAAEFLLVILETHVALTSNLNFKKKILSDSSLDINLSDIERK
jgi:hypothetical protein